MLSDLDPNRPTFLSTFLSLVDLGSFIDSEALAEHVNRTCLNQKSRPACFMRDTKDRYVIEEVVRFLRGRGTDSVHAGAIFIQYVIPALIVLFSTLRGTLHIFLDTLSAKEFRLKSLYYVDSWSLSLVHLSWRQHSRGQDRSTG